MQGQMASVNNIQLSRARAIKDCIRDLRIVFFVRIESSNRIELLITPIILTII